MFSLDFWKPSVAAARLLTMQQDSESPEKVNYVDAKQNGVHLIDTDNQEYNNTKNSSRWKRTKTRKS